MTPPSRSPADHRADAEAREEARHGHHRTGYEREMAGVYYNSAAVIDADGSYLGKYRKNHIPTRRGSGRSTSSSRATSAIPCIKTRYATIGVYICYDRHFLEGARLLGLHGAEIVFNPSATVKGLSQYPLESWSSRRTPSPTATSWGASTASAPRPWNVGQFLRLELFAGPARQLPGTGMKTRTSWS